MKTPSWVSSLAVGILLLLLWVGERVVEAGDTRSIVSGVAAAGMLVVVALRFWRSRSASRPDVKRIENWLFVLALVLLSALLLYALQSDVYTRLMGASLGSGWPKLAGICSALWPVVLMCGLVPTLLVEQSYFAMARAPKMEEGRIREAMYAGFGFAFALTFACSLAYVAIERDVKADLSYFRMAKPGDASRRLIESLDSELNVYLFFAPGSDVGELVASYFDELKDSSAQLKVTRLDRDLEPKKAQEFSVNGNGVILVQRAGRKEQIFVGNEVEKSKSALRGLDAEVQKRLLQVARPKRTVYLTQGHGERSQNSLGGADQRATIALLYQTLEDQNYTVRSLTTAEGLGVEVPKDAAAVFVLGPEKAFTPAETAALEMYSKSGGRLLIALDPEAGLKGEELLKHFGVTFGNVTLANDQAYARTGATQTPADRANVATRSFSSHPTVNYLSRYAGTFVVMNAGAIEEAPSHSVDLTIDFPVRAPPSTWDDQNNNYEANTPPEIRKSWGLVAAVSSKVAGGKPDEESRTLISGDSDWLSDTLLNAVQGNQMLLVDGLKWLLSEEKLAGGTNSELDVPLTRTRQQDAFWFYGTTFLAPLAIIGFGFLARRRANSARKQQKEARV